MAGIAIVWPENGDFFKKLLKKIFKNLATEMLHDC